MFSGVLKFFNTKYLEMSHFASNFVLHFFHKFRLVRLVSLVSFSKRMDPPGSVLFDFLDLTGFENLLGLQERYLLASSGNFSSKFIPDLKSVPQISLIS